MDVGRNSQVTGQVPSCKRTLPAVGALSLDISNKQVKYACDLCERRAEDLHMQLAIHLEFPPLCGFTQ